MQHKNLAPQDSHSPSQERVENSTGSAIPALKAVKYTGIGTLYPTITVANATDDVRGITQAIIQDGSSGYLLCYGFMYNVDTSAWAPGTSLFADANGDLTSVSGGGPQIANVLKQHASTGVIQVTCLDTPAAGTVLVQDTDSIDLDTLGNLVTADLNLSTDPATASHEKAITTIKSGPSKGLHVEYPWASDTVNGILKAADWSVFDSKVDQDDPRFSAQNLLKVKQNPGTGEYATIASAIAAVTSPSSGNRWHIEVYPGTYVEPLLTVPSFVSISGVSRNSVVVEPDTSSHHVFSLSSTSVISFMSIRNAGAGYAGVYAANCLSTALVHDVTFSNCHIGLMIESTIGGTNTFVSGSLLGFINSTVQAIKITSNNQPVRVEGTIDNIFIVCTSLSTTDAISLDGDTVHYRFNGLNVFREASQIGNGIRITNGASGQVYASEFTGWDTCILIDNVGSNSSGIFSAVNLNNCLNGLVVDSPTATGHFDGYVPYDDVSINESSGFFIVNKDTRTITVAKKGGDFSSIKDAIDSINDATATNRYTVTVGPGIFVEDTITMKEFVDVSGISKQQTIIEVDGPNKHLIEACRNSELFNLTVRGTSGTGYALVHLDGKPGYLVTDIFNVNNVIFGAADTLISSHGDLGPATVFVQGCIYGGPNAFNTGFHAYGDGTYPGRIVVRGSTSQGGIVTGPQDFILTHGAGSEVLSVSSIVRSNSGGGNGIRIYDGARARIVSGSFRGFTNGLFVENVGSAGAVEVIAGVFADNTFDIKIDHPSTTGAISGVAAFSKISLPAGTDLSVSVADPEVPGIFFNGKLLYGEQDAASATDIAPLIVNGSTMGVINGGTITDGGGLNIDVASGFGYLMSGVFPTHSLRRIDWVNQSIAIPANTTRYIYFNSAGTLVAGASAPYSATIILLGRVTADATSIQYVENTPLQAHHYNNQSDRLLREALGPVYASGSITTESGVRQLQVTSGRYFFAESLFTPSGASPITWDAFYRSATPGVYTKIANQTVVSNTQYDDGTGTLASIPAGEYAKHSVYIVGGPSEKYVLVYAQATYSSLAAAETAPLPVPPAFIGESFARLAAVIVHEGSTNISKILDERPRLGFTASSTSSTSSHSALSDLLNDDHPQYFRTDGSRVMTGDIDVGGNNIIGVNLVDGVDVSSHASRHLPNGADALTTAAPLVAVGANTVNATGTANSLARSDHQHAVATGTPITQNPAQLNSAGTSNNLARADHVHNIPTDAPVALDANSSNTEGVSTSFARADHIHDVVTAAPIAITPDQANTEGVAAGLARADHVHNIPTSAPATANADGNNNQGVAASFSRSDHKHNIATGTPVSQAPDQGNAEGASANLARADHVHNIPADAPTTTLSPATTNAEGAAASFARSNHTHAVATGLVGDITTIQPDATAAAGTVDRFARSDHRHAIDAAAPTTNLSPATTNAEGVGTSFARNDHTHAVETGLVGDITTIQPDATAAAGTVNRFARADHRHAIDAAAPVNTGMANSEGVSTSFARADHVHNTTINHVEVSSSTPFATNSTTDVVITGFTSTPAAGTYVVLASMDAQFGDNNRVSTVSIYANGVQVTNTERSNNHYDQTRQQQIGSQCVVTVNGSQAIDVRVRVSAGTVTVGNRSLILMRMGS